MAFIGDTYEGKSGNLLANIFREFRHFFVEKMTTEAKQEIFLDPCSRTGKIILGDNCS